DDDRVEPEERRDEPEATVEHEVEPEDPALRLAPASARPVPEQDPEDQQIEEEVVGGDRMHEVALTEGGRVRVAHAPRKSRARDRVVLAVDDVADPADRLAEHDADHGDVEHEAQREAKPPAGD